MIGFRKTGWIGVDIGSRAVKLAQVEQVGGTLRLRDARVIQRRAALQAQPGQELAPTSSVEEIRTALSLGERFRGRTAACILPMGSCDIRPLDIPLSGEAQRQAAVAAELNVAFAACPETREFDFWTAGAAEQDAQKVIALSVDQGWGTQVGNDLKRSGLQAEVLDGLPLALARAVGLATDTPPRQAIALIDWGYTTTTFCAVLDGVPAYVRSFRNSGYRSFLEATSQELGVSQDDAQRLLSRHGLPSPDDSNRGIDSPELAIGTVSAEPWNRMLAELDRTLSYLKNHRQALVPCQMWLFGGGSTVKHAASRLACHLGIPVDAWRMGAANPVDDSGACPEAILGPAIALSLLGCER